MPWMGDAAPFSCSAHDSCFLGPALSLGRHFPGRPPSGLLCPVQMSRPRPQSAQARDRWASARPGGEPHGDGGACFFWTAHRWRQAQRIDLSIRNPGGVGVARPRSVTPVLRPISGQPRSPDLDGRSLPRSPLICSATVPVQVPLKQT